MWWIAFLVSAAAQTVTVEVPAYIARDPDALAEAMEDAAARMDPSADRIVLMAAGPDGVLVPAERLLPEAAPVPEKDGIWPGGPPVDLHGPTEGSLTGKAIYASQCHGWIWSEVLDRFATQRGNVHSTVEDFHNPEGMNQYLIRYLENAGAQVFSTRERDHNTNLAIADNDGEGYSEAGEGFEGGAAGFLEGGPWAYGENPFDAGTTRRFPADGGGTATWIPEVPADGVYALYVAWDSDPDNAADAHYRITHPGGVIDRFFDQRVHGSTWQYVETLWLPAGIEGLTVELVGDAETGEWLSADAVRIGGGMGDVQRHGVTTERPRHEEGAILYNQYNGAPTSVYDPYGDGDGSDPSTRSRWAAWEHPSGEDALYLSWHSNAFDGTARGTVTYYYEGDYTPVEGSGELADVLQDELMGAITSLWSADWYDRGVKRASFSEVSPYHNDEIPSALVELAFHDNEIDAGYLKEPGFRRDMSRAMYRGVVRYFAERDGESPVFLPEPPEGLAITHDADGKLLASWTAGAVGDPFGDAADSFMVYQSKDGHSWDEGTMVEDTQATVPVRAGATVFVRITAVNTGGESFPTETLGARRSSDGWAPVLVVSAFDRLRSSNLIWEEVPSLDWIVRMPLERVNAFDTTVPAGTAIAQAGWYFDSVSDEVFAGMDLSDYHLIVWTAGQESTEDETLDHDQQMAVRNFLTAGGAVLVTGSEVLWDLDHLGDADDQAFAQDILQAEMKADDAGTEIATGKGVLNGLLLDFGESDGAPYPVGYPDVLETDGTVIAVYDDGETAGVLHANAALLGFPFECIGDPYARNEVMARLLPVLAPDYDPPEDPGEEEPAEEDTGVDDLPDLEGDEEEKGCACSASPPPALSGFIALAALAGIRRRS